MAATGLKGELQPTTSTTTVSGNFRITIDAPPPPGLLGPSGTQVSPAPQFTWGSVEGASSYQIMIATTREALPTSASVTTCAPCVVNVIVPSTTFTPLPGVLQVNTTYFWQVKGAFTAPFIGDPGQWSDAQIFTTRPPDFIFGDDPLLPLVTTVQARHLLELRDAINQRRRLVDPDRPEFAFSKDPPDKGQPIFVKHLVELRNALAEAFAWAGRTLQFGEDVTQTVTTIKASHIVELRRAAEALR
jgi:hypothetical protein